MSLPKYSKGFTLIEILISVSILAILSAGIVPSFSGYIKNQNLKQAQEQLKSDLRSVQNRALTGSLSDLELGTPTKRVAYWGVRFTNNSNIYYYFISTGDSSCPPANSQNQGNSTLSNDVKYFGDTGCLFFSIKNGDITTVSLSSPLTLKYKSADSVNKTVIFNSAGLIYTSN